MPTSQPASILPLQYIKGVGPRRAEALAREGIVTAEDVIWSIPRGYVDRTAAQSIASLMQACRASNLWTGEAAAEQHAVTTEVSLIATIADVRQRTVGKGKSMLTVVVRDGSGVDAHLVFWNQITYYSKRCRVGAAFVISGVPEYDARWNQLSSTKRMKNAIAPVQRSQSIPLRRACVTVESACGCFVQSLNIVLTSFCQR